VRLAQVTVDLVRDPGFRGAPNRALRWWRASKAGDAIPRNATIEPFALPISSDTNDATIDALIITPPMPLSPGAPFAQYEILAPLGAGGRASARGLCSAGPCPPTFVAFSHLPTGLLSLRQYSIS
jgi:hypothetical protein